jgi:uncharacterized protein (TIGR02996 family)
MDTGDGLLQAIIDEPDDNNLRLIYADWLQDHGQPDRAEFIRVEIAMHARWPDTDGSEPEKYDDPGYHRLAVRQRELLEQHEKEWFGAIDKLTDHYQTSRGFVLYFDTTARQFAQRADELLAAAPVATQMFLDRLGKNMPAVARRPELARFRELGFVYSTLGDRGLSELCKSPYVHNLQELNVNESQLGPDACRAIAASPSLGRLVELNLYDNPIYDIGAQMILRATNLPALTRVNLRNCGLTDSAAVALDETDDLPGLVLLDLGYNHLTPDGARLLASSTRLASLEHLLLFGNNLGEGVRAFATSPHLRSLRELHLGWTQAEDGALADLLRSKTVASVEELTLINNPFGPAATAALGDSDTLTRVRTLNLDRCQLGVAAMEQLARDRVLAVETLDLDGNPVGPEGIQRLLHGTALRSLRKWYLSNCQIGDAGAEAIARTATLGNLRYLNLSSNRIEDTGARALAGSKHLKQIGSLDLSGNKIGKRARKALAERFGEGVCEF